MSGRKHTEEEQTAVDHISSSMTLVEFSEQTGISRTALWTWVGRLSREGKLDILVFSPIFYICPLMARTVQHRDPRVREYLREVYLESLAAFPSKSRKSQLSDFGNSVFSNIESMFARNPRLSGVSVEELLSFTGKGYGKDGLSSLRIAVFAALRTGFHTSQPFFDWAVENEEALRKMRSSGNVLADALRDDGFMCMRVMPARKRGPHVFSYDCNTPFCIELLDSFLASQRFCHNRNPGLFCRCFTESLGFIPENLTDFTPSTFGAQLEWFRDNNLSKETRKNTMHLCRAFYLHLLELLPEDQTAFTFETGLPPRALAHGRIMKLWLEGYRCAVHEPLDPIPSFPKVIVYPNADEALKSSVDEGHPILFDLSIEGDLEMEAILMRWVWQESSLRKVHDHIVCVKHLALSITRGERAEDNVYMVTARMVRDVLSSNSSGAHHMSSTKRYLKRFLLHCKDEGFNVQPGCWLLLETTVAERKRNRDTKVGAVSEEHLVMLAGKLEERASESLVDELAYIAFVVQTLTDLRMNEILGLRAADINVGPHRGIRAVRVCRKTSGKGFQNVQVTEEIYRLLQTAARITEPVRALADEAIAGYLFLYESAVGSPCTMSRGTYAYHIELACERLGIPRVCPANIRKRYITTAVEEGIRNGISRLSLRSITGHANVGSDSPYLRPDIMSHKTRKYLEGAFLVEIGVHELRGEVLSDCDLPDEFSAHVEGGAGICRNEFCHVAGSVPCLMCKGFATSPRYIPEMLDAITTIDGKIKRASPHDREHLLEAKCVYLAYLGKMIDKEEERG